ncbi:MAG: Na+/H+ antiporter subunit D, partial [Bacteroidetes bacterium]|nr:Na+/H+ antiporter subunit D [Bacteroidota bacterium]
MTADLLLVLPLVIPLAAAVMALFVRALPRVQAAINLISMTSVLAVSLGLLAMVQGQGIQAFTAGGWPAPFGIVLVADHLSVIMLIVSAIIGVAVAVYAIPNVDATRVHFGFYPFMNL